MKTMLCFEDERHELKTADEECFYCGGEGVIETDNNGPIGPCPICKRENQDNA